MRLIFPFTILFCVLSCSEKNKEEKSDYLDNASFEKVYTFALRGELGKVFAILDTIKIQNPQELKIKNKFYARFINDTERFDYHSQDSSIIQFVDNFHTYWKSVMIDSLAIEKADSLFERKMARYLFKEKYGSENVPVDSIQQNLYKYSNEFVNEKGYFSNAFGKTGMLYDLFLWKKNDVVKYTIELIDDTVEVTVHLMDDFISTGWSHYTTFGKSYTGGWANREALFCVVSAYDLTSENYKVSYLAHEGQHFSDYKRYPALQQRDLEYRAKLVELVKSNSTTYDLLNKFIKNSSGEPINAHAFANYCVIKNLSDLIFNTNDSKKEKDLLLIDAGIIRQKSKMLYYAHSKVLDSLGSEIVTAWIH